MTTRWYGDRLVRRLQGRARYAVRRAAEFLKADIKIAFPGSGVSGGRRGVSKREREKHRSKPGEIPHVQSGHLKDSIEYEMLPDGMTARIGPTTIAKYGLYLERGTPRMAARPFLRPALRRNRMRLRRILERNLKL